MRVEKTEIERERDGERRGSQPDLYTITADSTVCGQMITGTDTVQEDIYPHTLKTSQSDKQTTFVHSRGYNSGGKSAFVLE